jgi:threonine/homoserine/homoserine lactone efflux protein
MLYVFVTAFVLGFVISIPIGAVGQLMINRALKYGLSAGLSIGLFSALLDATYCELALIGISLVINSVEIRLLVQGMGLIVLLYFGYKNFRPKKELSVIDDNSSTTSTNNHEQKWTSHLKYFPVVLMATVSNPTMLAFWVNMAQVLRSSVLTNAGVREFTLFSVGVGLGSALCQYIVLQTIRQARLFRLPKSRVFIQWVSAFIFMFTMAYFIYQFFKELLLNKM